MTRLERRVAVNTGIVGVLLTLIAVALGTVGFLRQPEDWLYDLRARHFQFFKSAPTDRLVHVSIDDRSQEELGRWPWPRSLVAELLDEIHLARPKAVALDILFTEPQVPTVETEPAAGGGKRVKREIDNDALLASSIERSDRVVVPASVLFESGAGTPLVTASVEALTEDIELTAPELLSLLRGRGFRDQDVELRIARDFIGWRREATLARISREMKQASPSTGELRKLLLRRTDTDLLSPLAKLIDDEFERYQAREALRERIPEFQPGKWGSLLPTRLALAPIPALSRAASATAFVDRLTSSDGKLRSIPLLLECEGRLIPQIGLALALKAIGSTLEDVRCTPDKILITRPDKSTLTVPVRTVHSDSLDRDVPAIFDIPWFGPSRWEGMYGHREVHVSMNFVWEACRTRRAILRNIAQADEALRAVLMVLESPKLDRLDAEPLPPDKPEAWYELIDATLRDAEPRLASFLNPQGTDAEKQEAQVFLASVQALRNVRQQNPQLAQQLAERRRALSDALAGSAIFIGSVATGQLDVVTTSIHPIAPGVVAHGVIFNAIMTGDFWRLAPRWAAPLATVICGLVAATAVTWLSPTRALLAVLLLATGYVLFNGLVVFDYGNRIMDLASPLLALGLAWSGASMTRIIMETGERHRLTQRFSHYVDPSLVNYLLERPDQVRLEGETRELTVCFTDLVGFTTLSELIGEKSVGLLNEYMGRMVPIIRQERGYLNKFLGDGIMFFFGAPVHDPDHALHAVTTALRMQEAMGPLNEELTRRALPTVAMRVGISTGRMVVGDAGCDDASDYTVLGDSVNLGARLESANKITGTSILMTERTRQLVGEKFLLRPAGKLQVVGKSEGVVVFEPLALAEQATPEQRRLVELSTELVDRFIGKRYGDCLATAERLESEFGKSRFTSLYRDQCEAALRTPNSAPADGRIVVVEK